MAPSDKLFPAATDDDQEGIVRRELGTPIRIGTPAFSSPDPATDGLRMVPIEEDVTGEQGAETAASDPKKMKAGDFKDLLGRANSEEDIAGVEQVYKDSGKEYSSVVEAIDKRREELAEANFTSRVQAATNQDELDAVTTEYEESGLEFDSVNDAIETKTEELSNS